MFVCRGERTEIATGFQRKKASQRTKKGHLCEDVGNWCGRGRKEEESKRKVNRSFTITFPECSFCQVSLIHYFKNKYFCHVRVIAASLGKPCPQLWLQVLLYPGLSLGSFSFPVLYTQQILIMMSSLFQEAVVECNVYNDTTFIVMQNA